MESVVKLFVFLQYSSWSWSDYSLLRSLKGVVGLHIIEIVTADQNKSTCNIIKPCNV